MSSGKRFVAAPSSAAKQAPRSRNTASTSAVAPTLGSTGGAEPRAASSNQCVSARNTTAMRVAFDGAPTGASAEPASRARGVSRSHWIWPSWQSRSRNSGR